MGTAGATRIETRSRADATEILCRINHPMETGHRTSHGNSKKVPAHFIQKIAFELNGEQVAEVHVGTGIAADPLLMIRVKGVRSGDAVTVRWTDNWGERGGASTTVS
ncbi:MAG: thiosulfate oxidation carrier complex protein SoxZ [Acidiferrobacterales bacterium]